MVSIGGLQTRPFQRNIFVANGKVQQETIRAQNHSEVLLRVVTIGVSFDKLLQRVELVGHAEVVSGHYVVQRLQIFVYFGRKSPLDHGTPLLVGITGNAAAPES
uniref:(northern house mosquito) hypothetical protein n=1 Tax=Culex pipiens TaxID=7175 RepID=A0A8D8CN86_CULPI